MPTRLTRLAAATLYAALLALPVLAADSGSVETEAPLPPPVDCIKEHGEGWVYSEEKQECVREEALDDAGLYRLGETLARAGEYERALDVLGAVRDKHDAMTLTMIGYATRKLGRVEEGIAIYRQALAIDPTSLNTHEYLGEGYLAAGRIDLAEVQLDTLARLCGTTCDQYLDLERAIAGDPGWN